MSTKNRLYHHLREAALAMHMAALWAPTGTCEVVVQFNSTGAWFDAVISLKADEDFANMIGRGCTEEANEFSFLYAGVKVRLINGEK
jgi:hypothetical protein